mgnify:CR=1 FL=1
MKAIILAAGIGSRLYPLTSDRPKCLLKIDGESILEFQVQSLKSCGINDIVVVTGYLSELIMKKPYSEVRYRYYKDYSKTNNLYTLYSIRDELNEDTIILFSDVLLSLKLLKRCVENKGDNYNLIIDNNNITEKTMRVKIHNNSIYDIGNHIPINEAHGNFIGIGKFSEVGARTIKIYLERYVNDDSHINDYYTSVFYDIAKENHKISYTNVNGEPWIEIDDMNDYNKAIAENISIYRNN